MIITWIVYEDRGPRSGGDIGGPIEIVPGTCELIAHECHSHHNAEVAMVLHAGG